MGQRVRHCGRTEQCALKFKSALAPTTDVSNPTAPVMDLCGSTAQWCKISVRVCCLLLTKRPFLESRARASWFPARMCVNEIGCAIQSKRSEQILLAQMQRPDLPGTSFDLPNYQCLQFKNGAELDKILPRVLEPICTALIYFHNLSAAPTSAPPLLIWWGVDNEFMRLK